MQNNEKMYSKILNKAFHYSNMILKNEDIAKEVAQVIAIDFFINDRIKSVKNLDSWLYITTRNKCYDILKSRKKDLINNSFEYNDNILLKKESSNNCINFKEMMNDLPSDLLNLKEKELFRQYYDSGCDLNKLVKKSNLKLDSLRKKIYRIISEITAYIKRKEGYNNSLEIAGPKLRENIYNFINRFRKCCENNDIDSMSGYFGKCKIPEEKDDFDISEVVNYCVDCKENNRYKLWVTYLNRVKEVRCLITEFLITKSNCIRVTTYPKLPKKIIKIENKAIPKHIDDEIMPDRKGIYHKTSTEVEDLISGLDKEIIFEK